MNKIDFAKINKKEDMIMAFNQLKDDYSILFQQIQELTNNWNELRQHIEEYLKEWENSDDEWVKGKCDMARDILYDMEEIKEGKNDKNKM